jgi:phosphotransacetylase
MMANNWESEILDITTAFLHGPMEEKVFMNCPEGIDLYEEIWDCLNDCTELMKTIYGTKQAAQQFWKTFMTTMERKGFDRTHADSCLLKRKDESGTELICVYVDDCLITGERTAIHNAINDIESRFETRRLGTLNEYIGCTFQDMKN